MSEAVNNCLQNGLVLAGESRESVDHSFNYCNQFVFGRRKCRPSSRVTCRMVRKRFPESHDHKLV